MFVVYVILQLENQVLKITRHKSNLFGITTYANNR